MQDPAVADALAAPVSEETFRSSKLKLEERTAHAEAYALHGDLLKLRRCDPVIGAPRRLDGAVLSPDAFLLRFFGDGGDRLLLVNLGADLDLRPAPEPLLAPPAGRRWQIIWSSESVRYGGQGTPALHPQGEWHLPGEAAVLLGDERNDAE